MIRALTNHQAGTGLNRRFRGGAWATSLLLAACVTAPVVPPDEAVRQRASDRWTALIKREFANAYVFTTPAYRDKVDAEAYRNQFGPGTWTSAEVVKVACPDSTQCISTVRIESKNPLYRKFGDSISTHVEETWLLVNGEWYLAQK